MSLKFDFRDFERVAARLDAFADQIPYALAQSLNDGAEAARRELIETTWPSHVKARNASFMRAALSTKGTRASKKNLRVAIYDRLERASLFLHAEGGTKTPKGSALAVPSSAIADRRRSTGVPKGMRPRALPNSFVKGDSIFQRVGPKKRQLKLAYTLKPSTRIAADVPFEDDFERVMRREVSRAFGPRIKAAMETRKTPGKRR